MANELQPLSKIDYSEYQTTREAMLGNNHSWLIFGMISSISKMIDTTTPVFYL